LLFTAPVQSQQSPVLSIRKLKSLMECALMDKSYYGLPMNTRWVKT
jgi:hypothetical protein